MVQELRQSYNNSESQCGPYMPYMMVNQVRIQLMLHMQLVYLMQIEVDHDVIPSQADSGWFGNFRLLGGSLVNSDEDL